MLAVLTRDGNIYMYPFRYADQSIAFSVSTALRVHIKDRVFLYFLFIILSLLAVVIH